MSQPLLPTAVLPTTDRPADVSAVAVNGDDAMTVNRLVAADGDHSSLVAERPETEFIIEASTGWVNVDFAELWRHHELLYFLIWRDIRVRYKQTVLGVLWAVLVPLLSILIFTVVFGNFAGFKHLLPERLEGAYPLYVYAGLLPWLFFSNAISMGGTSLVNQQHLLSKIYFPRLFVPTAAVGGALVDTLISLLLFGALMAWYRIAPPVLVVLLPLLLLLTCVASLGIAFLLAALTVRYRDFRFIIPFLVQIWQFVSPVVYPSTIVPERYRWIAALNPLSGIIDAYRATLLGVEMSWQTLTISTVSSVVLFVIGVAYFRKTERSFADIA